MLPLFVLKTLNALNTLNFLHAFPALSAIDILNPICVLRLFYDIVAIRAIDALCRALRNLNVISAHNALRFLNAHFCP